MCFCVFSNPESLSHSHCYRSARRRRRTTFQRIWLVRDDGICEAFEHFYNSDYDLAIQDFEKTQKAHPDDPFATNHLLEAVLVREIDREGALNAELYLVLNSCTRKR